MGRPSLQDEKRRELTPVLAAAFAELGYRRATTAALARRCRVRENILYRIWPDKKAMFIAAIDFVYDQATAQWLALVEKEEDGRSSARRLLEHEARHHGEHGYYRILFAGLSELDDPAIRAALGRVFERFAEFIKRRILAHRGSADAESATLNAWGLIGLGFAANILRELKLFAPTRRERLIREIGQKLVDPS